MKSSTTTCADPYNPDNLRHIADRYDLGGIEAISATGLHAILILPDGTIYVAPHGSHDKIVKAAMSYGQTGNVRWSDLEGYYQKAGVLHITTVCGRLEGRGVWEPTSAQVKALKDICMFAEVKGPQSINLICDVDPHLLCRGL